MILRKPYAFLIKHFKLIHLILAILSCYCIFRTKTLLDFFNDYVITMVNVIGQDLNQLLIPTFYKVVPLCIILVTLIILIVMIIKKKPYAFYIFNIIVYVFVFIVILYVGTGIEAMTTHLIDAKTARLLRDFSMLAFLVQFASFPIILIRAIGFDIKKFNFKEDIIELDINEDDREEFEVNISLDKNRIIRNIRRRIRFLIYSYKENKSLYNLSFLGAFVAIIILVGISYFNIIPTISQNSYFSGNGLMLNITDSYLVNTDYQGNILDEDNFYLLVRLKVKSTGVARELDIATTKIVIGNYSYTPISKYKERFFDFGTIYQGEKISNQYEDKVLVYEIPKQLVNNSMVFYYLNKNSFNIKDGFQSVNVKLNYQDLTGVISKEKIYLGSSLDFNDSILNDFKIQITDYDIQDKFKINYDFCISKECFSSSEYLKPNLNTNYEKTLLKLTGFLNYENQIQGIYDLYDFIESFGKICYTIDGSLKIQSIDSNQIVSKKAKDLNNIYIEVPKEIQNSDSIFIVFTVRNKVYQYYLKY